MHDDLTLLAIRNGTDKFGYHDYTPNYHSLFARFRDQELRVLEIGVGGYGDEDRGGESLATWRDYFPKARIIGLDIQKKVLDFGPRVRIVQGSQVDADFLAQIVAEEGPFDLIIDDGSHQNEHVIESFKILFPTLAPGGTYVVEDTQTAFVPRRGGSPALKQPNSVGFFAQLLQRLLTGTDGPDIIDVPAKGLSGMERFHNMVALHKAEPETAETPVSWLEYPALTAFAGLENLQTAGRDETASMSPDALLARFDAVPMGGALLLERAPVSEALAEFMYWRFVEIDHMEQRVHFPDAPVHRIAAELRSLTVTPGVIALWRAANTYPSNFAFDPKNPEAVAVLARRDEVLADGKPWPGAIGQIDFKLRFGRPEDALELVRRFGDGKGQPRRFFYGAVASMRLTGHIAEVRPLLETAAALYPDDPAIVIQLVALRIHSGETASAEALLEAALSLAPRQRRLHTRLVQLKLGLSKLDEAEKLALEGHMLFAAKDRGPMNLLLAQIQMRQGRPIEAKDILQNLIARATPEIDRAYRLLSEAHLASGDRVEALAAIEQAIRLRPQLMAYQLWRDRIAS